MFGLGPMELFAMFVIALIFIGPKKLPDLAKGLGKSIREFQKAKDDVMTEIHRDENEQVAHLDTDPHKNVSGDDGEKDEDDPDNAPPVVSETEKMSSDSEQNETQDANENEDNKESSKENLS